MNKATLTLALAALMVASASAGDFYANKFPPQLPPQPAQQTAKQFRAPLNQEKKRGDKVFGYTQLDNTRMFCSYVNYYSNEYLLEYVGPAISKAEEDHMRSLYALRAGAYNPDDGFYYGYKCKCYTFEDQAYKFVKVNPVTGEWTEIMDLDNDYENNILYELAYNYYSSEMYALTQNNDGTVTTRLCKLDIPGGSKQMTDFVNLGDYYFCCAFDMDGYMYAVRWVYDESDESKLIGSALDKFDKNFKKIDSKELLVDGKPWLAYFQHGMDVDYTTGDLVWVATDTEGKQAMVRINPETGATTRMGNHGIGFNNEVMLGLYVPYTVAEDREAPAIVTDLEFQIDRTGKDQVTLNWTNPKTLWNRQPMSNLKSVVIYRDNLDGEPITTIDATGKEGKYMGYTDKEATPGVHKYYVMGVNEAGRGVETSIEAYVGHDKPGAVNNLNAVATEDGLGVKVTWEAPTVGDSEGWFDKTITYNVKRLPDNKQVASGLTTMEYTDANIEEAQFYSYEITPVNDMGEGTPLVSNGVLAGASIKIPFKTSFGNQAEADRFTSFGPVGDYKQFQYETKCIYVSPMVPCLRYTYQNGSNNAMLVSPKLNVKKGQKYRVDWKFVVSRYGKSVEDCYHNFCILGGTEPKYESMTDSIWADSEYLTEKKSEVRTVTTYFTAPVDGDYCIGFQILSEGESSQSPVFDMLGFAVDNAPANDIEATKLQAPALVSNTFDNIYTVTVYNNGDKDQSDFEVQVGLDSSDGTFQPISAAKAISTLKSHEYGEIRVVGHAEGHNGEQELRARVILKGDENENNDYTDYVPVTIAESDAYAYFAYNRENPDNENYKTWMPFKTSFSNQSGTQTIYTRQELLLQPDQEIEICGLGYEYKADSDVKDFTAHIWLGTTDKEFFGTDTNPILEGLQQMVTNYDLVFPEAHEKTFFEIPFDKDKTFKLPAKKNLTVSFGAEDKAGHQDFSLGFYCYGTDPTVSDGEYHTLILQEAYDPSQATKTRFESIDSQCIPNLYLKIKQAATNPYKPGDLNGIETIGMGKGMSVKVVAGEAILNGVETLALYDLSGAMIMNLSVNGAKAVKLPVEKGVYILRAANGSEVKTIKVAL